MTSGQRSAASEPGSSQRVAFGGMKMPTRSAGGGGLFARLNKPLVHFRVCYPNRNVAMS